MLLRLVMKLWISTFLQVSEVGRMIVQIVLPFSNRIVNDGYEKIIGIY